MTANKEIPDVLRTIMPRLWQVNPLDSEILALEVTQGPYKGVVFSYRKFEVIPRTTTDGFVPVKFETTIHIIPGECVYQGVVSRVCQRGTSGCNINHPAWEPDEAFDSFSSEVLFQWLAFINLHTMGPLMRAETNGTVQ